MSRTGLGRLLGVSKARRSELEQRGIETDALEAAILGRDQAPRYGPICHLRGGNSLSGEKERG